MRSLAGALTAALHAAFFLAVFPPTCTSPPAPPPPPPPPRAPETVVEVKLLSSGPGDDGPPCVRWYTGIGVRHSWGINLLEVVPGAPADVAGARVGDEFINHAEFEPNRYAIGEHKVMVLSRGGVILNLPVTIGRICQEK